MRSTTLRSGIFILLFCLPFFGLSQAQYIYTDNDKVKACFKGYCESDSLKLSELNEMKTLKLIVDDKNFKVIEFYINLTDFDDMIFIERVRYDHLNRNYLNLLAKSYKSLKLTEILVRDKDDKLYRLKPVFYLITP